MILVVDNYGSFTYNLVQLLGELGQTIEVFRNDAIDAAKARALEPTHLVLSPGPGHPRGAGASNDLIKAFLGAIPILGVGLGHQCLAHVFGGTARRADRLMHGKTSLIYHDGKGIYASCPNPFTATRYHSLCVPQSDLPECLEITAHTSDGEIMGLRHREATAEGVQFHPESILTTVGMNLLRSFLML